MRKLLLITMAGVLAGSMTSRALAEPSQTDLELWFKADSSLIERGDGNQPEVGDSVKVWKDVADGHHHAVSEASETQRPIYNEVGGHGVVSFSYGVGSYPCGLPVYAVSGLDTDTLTVFLVARAKSTSNTPGTFLNATYTNGTASANSMWGMQRDNGSGLEQAWARSGSTETDPHVYSSSSSLTDSSLHIYSSVWASDDSITLILDGSAAPSGTAASGIPSVHDALWIGARDGQIDALYGDIAEILIYSNDLDAAAQNEIGYYLEQKYGIDSAYTPEPATLSLLAVGLACIIRKKRRAN